MFHNTIKKTVEIVFIGKQFSKYHIIFKCLFAYSAETKLGLTK